MRKILNILVVVSACALMLLSASTASANVDAQYGWGIWQSSYNQNESGGPGGQSPNSPGGPDVKATSDRFIASMAYVGRTVDTARFILNIDTLSNAGSDGIAARDRARLDGFLSDNRIHEKLITFGVPRVVPSTDYEAKVRQLMDYVYRPDSNLVGQVIFGPANEPNFGPNDSHQAAAYYYYFKEACRTCRVIAGEFGEIQPGNPYAQSYFGDVQFYTTLVGKPAAWGIHSYSNGTADSVANGRLAQLTQQYRTTFNTDWRGLSGIPIWCTECGVRIDNGSVNHYSVATGPLRSGPLFPTDDSTYQRDRAYHEQVGAGASFGQAGYDAAGPKRIYFSTPESAPPNGFDPSSEVRAGQPGANGNRARPGYCGFIYSQNSAADSICASLKPNVYASGLYGH